MSLYYKNTSENIVIYVIKEIRYINFPLLHKSALKYSNCRKEIFKKIDGKDNIFYDWFIFIKTRIYL